MKNTTYLGLKKPESNDFYNIENENYNMDLIDSEFKRFENITDIIAGKATVVYTTTEPTPGATSPYENGTLIAVYE